MSLSVYGSLRDMGLPEVNILSVIPSIYKGLAPEKHAVALALLKEYADLFSTGPHDCGLLKDTQISLN